jgi:hypothetical protein
MILNQFIYTFLLLHFLQGKKKASKSRFCRQFYIDRDFRILEDLTLYREGILNKVLINLIVNVKFEQSIPFTIFSSKIFIHLFLNLIHKHPIRNKCFKSLYAISFSFVEIDFSLYYNKIIVTSFHIVG